jgi:hypothetical protein
MIPIELDDGFTVEMPSGLFCRPMLWGDRQALRDDIVDMPHRSQQRILSPPYTMGRVAEGDERAAIQQVLGYTVTEENRDFQALSDSADIHVRLNTGMSLLNCSQCKAVSVDHRDGSVYEGASGRPTALPPGTLVPCETHQGCIKGHHSAPLGLSNPRWARTWSHYWKYRGSRQFALSSDPIFRRNRVLLDWIVDYGRDSRFDPFIGGGTGGGSTDGSPEGVLGQTGDRACSPWGNPTRGACRTRRRGELARADGGDARPVQSISAGGG